VPAVHGIAVDSILARDYPDVAFYWRERAEVLIGTRHLAATTTGTTLWIVEEHALVSIRFVHL